MSLTEPIRLWTFPLTPSSPLSADLLSFPEKMRYEKMGSRQRQSEYLQSHAAMRLCLAGHFGVAPEKLRLTFEEGKSPRLEGGQNYLSLSHADGLAVFALSPVPVGVDVEPLGRKKENLIETARMVFGEKEVEALSTLEGRAREDEFTRLWVLHEALFKMADGEKADSHKTQIFTPCAGYLIALAYASDVSLPVIVSTQESIDAPQVRP